LTHSVGWIISNPGAALFARPPPHFSIALSKDQWDFLEKVVQRTSEGVLDEIIEFNDLSKNRIRPATNALHHAGESPTATYGLPPCAIKMLEGVTCNRRVICFRLAIHLKKAGLPFDMAVEVLNVWTRKNRPINKNRIISPEEIKSQATSAFEKGYRGCGLEDPIIKSFCEESCPIRMSIEAEKLLEPRQGGVP